MKIKIYDSKGLISYNPNNLNSKGIGGVENCIVNLAKELSRLNNEVTVLINCDKDGVYDGVIYKNFNDYVIEDCDLFIGCESFPETFKANKTINWVHRPESRDARRFPVDKIVCVSEWARKTFLQDCSNAIVIENGIEPIFFETPNKKMPHRIIYAGYTGKGGMTVLPRIYNKLNEYYSDMEMIVCGGGGLWGKSDDSFKQIYKSLIDCGIIYVGQVGTEILANLMKSSSVLINPVGQHHRETFGLVVAQAMASGCIPVSSGEGNLSNLIGDNGITIFGEINSDEWIDESINKIKEIFSLDYYTIEAGRNFCKRRILNFNWNNTALEFLKLCNK
jgi:glycosyltransferase involved in cell wall biosynthesis